MAEKYAAARVNGAEPRAAARSAGYSDLTEIAQIERRGGPVDNLMRRSLAARGIDEDFIAKEYEKGLDLSLKPGAGDLDCQAHAKYLLQMGYLLGYGKQGPSVAVQINNGGAGATIPHEPGRVEDALREVRDLLGLVRAELGARDAGELHREGDPMAGGGEVPGGAESRQGVVQSGEGV